jgi:hypothetical protein
MKRTPLARKTPLKRKRDTPRRKAPERVSKRAPKGKSASEKRFHATVAQMPCAGCGAWPVEVHHVISDGFKRITRCHRLVLPLCPLCHRTGPTALHAIGTRAWNEMHGFAQHERAQQLWEAFDAAPDHQ